MYKQLFTIGHSNHTLQEFLDMLHAFKITHLVDVRTIPRSRHVPWFNKDTFAKVLHKDKIVYAHMTKLGGLRHTHKDSQNKAWQNLSFRGFADYMQTSEFFEGLTELNQLIQINHRVVIMCAEALPWRCHRSLIADAEVIRHFKVYHITSKTKATSHKLTSFAVVDRTRKPMQILYP